MKRTADMLYAHAISSDTFGKCKEKMTTKDIQHLQTLEDCIVTTKRHVRCYECERVEEFRYGELKHYIDGEHVHTEFKFSHPKNGMKEHYKNGVHICTEYVDSSQTTFGKILHYGVEKYYTKETFKSTNFSSGQVHHYIHLKKKMISFEKFHRNYGIFEFFDDSNMRVQTKFGSNHPYNKQIWNWNGGVLANIEYEMGHPNYKSITKVFDFEKALKMFDANGILVNSNAS